jgi:hypothetical protein
MSAAYLGHRNIQHAVRYTDHQIDSKTFSGQDAYGGTVPAAASIATSQNKPSHRNAPGYGCRSIRHHR